ncbi:MAG: beta-galactosidase [Armatimonadota bacterium]|nr:MAG: beta-galactosidase [Armatimonadota bacterium]
MILGVRRHHVGPVAGAIVVIALGAVGARAEPPRPALRAASGEPVVAAYFFSRWWEPWRSGDDTVLADLARLRGMGVNTICLDHEPIQAFDGEWKFPERDHRLARQAGVGIIPWLELKCGADMSVHHQEIEQRYGIIIPRGEDREGNPANVRLHRPEYRDALATYVLDYLGRFLKDGAILRVMDGERARPVISLTVETGWDGASFDEETNALFRKWLRERYTDVVGVNRAWGTSYRSVDEIDPREERRFPYPRAVELVQSGEVPAALADHVLFRAELINDALAAVRDMVRREHPSLLFLAEVPYTFSSQHPHAIGHRYGAAMLPEAVAYADIVMFRTVDPQLSEAELRDLAMLAARGQRTILCHRTYSATTFETAAVRAVVARQAAQDADGLGYYSWNEMVDVHIARREDTDQSVEYITSINSKYRELAGPESH